MRSRGKLWWHLLAWAVLFVSAACRGTETDPPTVSGGDSADQVVFGLVHIITDDGVMRARVEADTSYLYEAQQLYDLVGVKMNFFSTTGETTSSLTADSGSYNVRTKDMQARGNVVGTSPDGRRLNTSTLNYERLTDRLVGPNSFVFFCDGDQMRGSSFTADPDFTNIQATNLQGPPCRTSRNPSCT